MSRAIIVVGKVPEPGRVKTRLIPALGARAATELYVAMSGDVLEIAEVAAARAQARPVYAFDGDPALAAGCAPGFDRIGQRPGDLGARLLGILEDVGAENAVLIGADAPALTAARIVGALEALERSEAVMIPAIDGGYVLLGVRGAPAPLFSGIPWSTAKVAAATEAAATAAKIRLSTLLPAVRDLDEPEDLPPMLELLPPASRTAVAIRKALGLPQC